MSCPKHGVVVERVPWAAHRSGFTFAFEEQTAWLALECSKTAVAELMRIAWRTVGRILERVAGRLLKPRRQLAGLRRPNALVEAVNTRIRLLTRRAFGFFSSNL